MAGVAEWPAKIERHDERAGHTDRACDLRHDRHRRRDDGATLELRLNQTNGLVAERSDGGEQRDVDPIRLEQRGRLGRRFRDETSGSRN